MYKKYKAFRFFTVHRQFNFIQISSTINQLHFIYHEVMEIGTSINKHIHIKIMDIAVFV